MTNKLIQGFTLIETLAAVLILSIALAGPMTIAEKGLSTALISKDQNSAFNLAQDAVEYIRFARDTNCLASGPGGCPATQWLNGIGGNINTVNLGACISTTGTNTCTVDSYNDAVAACASGVCPVMYYDSTNNDYNQSNTGTATIFTRAIQIVYSAACSGSCNAAEADIIVTVSWSDPVAHSVSVRESIYNWQ